MALGKTSSHERTVELPMQDLGVRNWLQQQAKGLHDALSHASWSSRLMTVFYLSGPFILLIERSPADIWMSICGIAFLGRCIVKKDWYWTRFFWVRAVLIFWLWCLFTAAISAAPAHALTESLTWIRFPLFAFASAFWLARDFRILIAMLISVGLGVFIMSFILFTEFIIIGQQGGRLSWPYGDLTPGNYLAKAGLPFFCVLIALTMSAKKKFAALAGILSLLTVVASLLTGERINFLVRAIGGMLAGLFYKPIWPRYILLVLIELAMVILVFTFKPEIGNRFVTNFISQLPFNDGSAYKRIWNGAIDAFQASPIFGIGPDNYRLLCPKISAGAADVACHTHPHNFYLQILGETGSIGLILAMVMIASVVWKCLKTYTEKKDDLLAASCFVVPIVFFFPIQSTADFFGQWNNIFMWSSIGFVLAVAHQVHPRQK